MRGFLLVLPLLVGCGLVEDEKPIVLDPPEELPLPDLSDIDWDTAFAEAVQLAISTDMRGLWSAHRASLALTQPACPDFWAGAPDVNNNDMLPEDGMGLSWSDHCETPGGRNFGGFQYWETDFLVEGDPTTVEGATTSAVRTLIGAGVVAQGDETLYEFRGEATDSFTRVEADGYSRFTYSSSVEGTATGTMITDAGQPYDLRTDMYLFYTGGDAQTLEARGNTFLFNGKIAPRFDSVHLDIGFAAPDSTAPEACELEPNGFISLRDENAFWYDLVFEPRYDGDATDVDYPNDPYTVCDGCGTIYIRGLRQEGLVVCPDLSFLWNEGTLVPPNVEDYALSSRVVLGEE